MQTFSADAKLIQGSTDSMVVVSVKKSIISTNRQEPTDVELIECSADNILASYVCDAVK